MLQIKHLNITHKKDVRTIIENYQTMWLYNQLTRQEEENKELLKRMMEHCKQFICIFYKLTYILE